MRIPIGFFPVNKSSQLVQIYQKRVDQIAKIREEIELPTIDVNHHFPNNIFVYLDITLTGYYVHIIFKNIYAMIFGNEFLKILYILTNLKN